jgi:hypothetical protein
VTQTVAVREAASIPSKALGARIVGVIASPRATYAAVAAQPHWVGVMAVVVLVGSAATFAFLSTEIGQQAMFDQQVRFLESFNRDISDARYQEMQSGLGTARYTGAVGQAVAIPAVALVIAGLAMASFNALLGGAATFRQVFAVVAHSGVLVLLAQLVALPLAYARESMSSATSLGVFVPFLDENSFMGRLLGSIDLFQVWWIVSLAIGFGVLYRRRSGPIAMTMLSIYVSIALVVATIRSLLSGA